jgi:subtilisin family serine protease
VSSNSYGATQCWQSWGCNIEARGIAPVIQDALELSQNRNNTVFVYTSGNEGRFQGSPNFRAFGSSPRLITVGATRIDGTRAAYSNVGAANWIVAPAGDNGGRVTWTSAISSEGQQCGEVGVGTSFAAPMVSGAAAILRSVSIK